MSVNLAPIVNNAQDNNGVPMVGGWWKICDAGTLNLSTIYTDNTGLVPNTNPVELNARGEPTLPIWLPGGALYDCYLLSPTLVQLRVIEDVSGINDASIVSTPLAEWVASDLIPTYIGATSFSVPGNHTDIFTVGRRLKIIISGSIVYSSILTATFAAGKTTITINNDSTAIDNTISAVSYSLLDPTNSSIVQTGVASQSDITALKELGIGLIHLFSGDNAQIPSNCVIVAPTVVNVNRAGAYAKLFAVIGTFWGAGDGVNTFGLPFIPDLHTFVSDSASNPGVYSSGVMPLHTHSVTPLSSSTTAQAQTGSGVTGIFTAAYTGTTGTAGSGSANLPAGRVVRFILQYK